MSHKKKFSDAVPEDKMGGEDDTDSYGSLGSLGSESSEPDSSFSSSFSSGGAPPARIHRRIPKKESSDAVPPLHLVGASPRGTRKTINSGTTFEPPTKEEKEEEMRRAQRAREALIGEFKTPPPSPQKAPPPSPKGRSKTILSVPASPKLRLLDKGKDDKGKDDKNELELSLSPRGSKKKGKDLDKDGFDLDLPLSPRSKKKKPPPTNLKRGESEDIESMRSENKNLQMALKFKEKEIADLKKRLDKEQKKNSKKDKKNAKKDGSQVEDEAPEESFCYPPSHLNTEFHLGNMSKDDCVPLNQYLQNFGKRSQSPEQSRPPAHAESLDSVTAKKKGSQQPWVIDPTEVQIYHELSRGSSAHVLLGLYRSQLVAVKVMKSSSNSKHIQDFKQEFQFAQLVKSRYNVYFYGVVFKPSLCLVMEFCERKSLHDLLRDKTIKLTWKNTLKFMYDFVKGVSILHNWVPPLVHRDIKSMNILITADWQVKLCDFGLTRATSMSQMEGTLAKVRGTYTHCAPEVFKGGSWSLMSDMYSVAVVVWEMCYRCVTGTHQIPYAEFPALKFDFQILMKASAGLRPSIPDPVPKEMKVLIEKGWDEDPQVRPTANQLLDILNHFMENYDEQGATWPCMDA